MSKKKGVTIVELMVASAILVALLGAYLTAFNNILNMANYSEGLSFAYTACLSQLEQIINRDFNSLSTGNWTFAPAGFPNPSRFISSGSITITDRPDLYGSGQTSWITATTAAQWTTRSASTSLAFDNRMWIMGGFRFSPPWNSYFADVWYSTNGLNWTQAAPFAWNGRFNHTSLVFDNKMWVIGGSEWFLPYVNDVWYSGDGTNWITATTAAQWTARYGHTSLVYNNRMWVMGGYGGTGRLNDVWCSNNGTQWWSLANAPWSARGFLTSLVFDNRMWVLGGDTGSNEVWYSTNGINWTQVSPNPGWAKYCHTSVVFDNKMWVIGGGNDVWYSTNGINWTQAAAPWGVRLSHTSVVYDNKMWLMSGSSLGTLGASNDVWYSTGYNRLLEVVITVCWKQPNGRLFGEDANLNGVLDVGEDKSNPLNGRLDSPAQLRILLSQKNMSNLRKVFLGRP